MDKLHREQIIDGYASLGKIIAFCVRPMSSSWYGIVLEKLAGPREYFVSKRAGTPKQWRTQKHSWEGLFRMWKNLIFWPLPFGEFWSFCCPLDGDEVETSNFLISLKMKIPSVYCQINIFLFKEGGEQYQQVAKTSSIVNARVRVF